MSFADKGYRLLSDVEKDLGVNQILNLVILTGIYRDLSQLDKALRLAKKSYALTQEMVNEEPLFTFMSLNNLAAVYYELGYIEKALPLLEKGFNTGNVRGSIS